MCTWVKLRDPKRPLTEKQVRDFCKDKVINSIDSSRLSWYCERPMIKTILFFRWLTSKFRKKYSLSMNFRWHKAEKCKSSKCEKSHVKCWASPFSLFFCLAVLGCVSCSSLFWSLHSFFTTTPSSTFALVLNIHAHKPLWWQNVCCTNEYFGHRFSPKRPHPSLPSTRRLPLAINFYSAFCSFTLLRRHIVECECFPFNIVGRPSYLTFIRF